MSSSHPQRLLYLDGWRGIAILLVLLGHFVELPVINVGRLGVELFFVLSGRLMAEILFIKGTKLPEFYRRRFSRIYPALLVFVLLMSAWFIVVRKESPDGRVIAGSLLFYANYLVAVKGLSIPSLEHIWSLSVEEHSYIVLSLLMLATLRWRRYAGPLIAAMAVLALANGAYQTYVLHGNYYQVFWRTDVRIASILMSAAFCIYLNRSAPAWLDRLLVPLGLLGVFLNINHMPDIIKYSVGTACLAIVVNRAAQLPQLVRQAMSVKPLVLFGVSSYSVYLWQQPFFLAMVEGQNRWLMLGCGLLAGVISYNLVENPARIWLNGLRAKKAAAPASGSAGV